MVPPKRKKVEPVDFGPDGIDIEFEEEKKQDLPTKEKGQPEMPETQSQAAQVVNMEKEEK